MIHRYQNHLKLILALIALLVSGLAGMDYLKDVQDNSIYATQINIIKEAADIKKIADFHKRLDHLRVFINQNSQHKEDAEFLSLWRDRVKLTATFIDHLEGRRKELPHMECSTRAGMMSAILQSEGYKTRAIDAYSNTEEELAGHALFDVWNPETKAWETQDPEYDVYWKNRKTGQRASMIEAAADKNIVPCNGKACGWNLRNREGNNSQYLKDHTAYMTAIDRNARERITFYRPGISPDATMISGGKKGKYCEVLKKNCKNGFLVSSKENIKQVKD